MPRTSNAAKNNPVAPSKAIETAELPIGQTVRKTDGTSSVGEPELIHVADRVAVDDEHEAMLRFMEEPVTIRPTLTADPKEQVFEINVNGRPELFRVGQEKTVARKYVDRMALTKATTYTQQEATNSDGIKQVLNIPHTRLRYDFAVVRDANPMGESWLKATLAMGG